MNVGVDVIANTAFDPMVLAKIRELEVRGEPRHEPGRLTLDEKEKLLDARARTLVKGRGHLGHRLRVEGRGIREARLRLRHHRHARRTSAGRVRYRYVDAPVKASALIVRGRALPRGREEGLARGVRRGQAPEHPPASAERRVHEGGRDREQEEGHRRGYLRDLASQNGEFSQDLIIPLDYFLFDKLHKRAMIYPPALYSYIKTYTCPSAPENRASSLDGFREAAKLLASQGFFELHGDGR